MSKFVDKALATELRRRLPSDIFRPARSRLLWLGVHLPVIAGGLTLLAIGVPLWARLLVSLFMGLSFAGLAFVGHEALHGALCRRAWTRRLVGSIGFWPFAVSPRLWVAWHNRVHHGGANDPLTDPDALSTRVDYDTSRAARVSTNLQRLTRGVLTLLIGFTVQSAHVLHIAKTKGYLNRLHYRRAVLATLTALVPWVLVLILLGPGVFLHGYVLPLLVGNVIVMMHIVTNHALRPLDDKNDPLDNSLSVTVPRWFSFYTLDFGYHVEHHMFPAMSNRHAPLVRDEILRLAKDRYRSLPLHQALAAVCRAPRVYENRTTLVDPRTGETLVVT